MTSLVAAPKQRRGIEHRPMSENRLNICVVNYKTAAMTIECLQSVLAERPRQSCVTIVDSHSEDGSPARIRQWVRDASVEDTVNLIELPANRGFSFAYNTAIRGSNAEFHLLLNSDTIVRPGAIEALLDAAHRNIRSGLFGPRLEWLDGQPQESCFRDFTPLGEMVSSAATGVVSSIFARSVVSLPVRDSEFEPEWLSFAAVMIRQTVLDKVGFLDEGFFLYFEDCEYCYRARLAGFPPLYVPTARIVHLRGGSSDVKRRAAATQRLPRYYYASRTRYFRLRHGALGPIFANLGWYAGRIVSLARAIVQRRKSKIPASAWRDIWIDVWGTTDV